MSAYNLILIDLINIKSSLLHDSYERRIFEFFIPRLKLNALRAGETERTFCEEMVH